MTNGSQRRSMDLICATSYNGPLPFLLRGTAWYCMVLCGTVWYCTVLRGTAWNCVELHGTARYCAVLRGTAWYCVVRPQVSNTYMQQLQLHAPTVRCCYCHTPQLHTIATATHYSYTRMLLPHTKLHTELHTNATATHYSYTLLLLLPLLFHVTDLQWYCHCHCYIIHLQLQIATQ